MKKELNIRPDTSVYAIFKAMSYKPWTAFAEFIDNSTQNYYDNMEVLDKENKDGLTIEIKYIKDKTKGDSIIISDNAMGMDYESFSRAIKLKTLPKNTIGRHEFGMGLKTAACWFGRLWRLESTMLGRKYRYSAEINIDSLEKNKNETIAIEENEIDKSKHYTILTIENLNQKVKGRRIEDKIFKFLSSIYRIDFRNHNVNVYYNGDKLEFKEPVPYIDNEGKIWKKDVEFYVPFKEGELKVTGFIAIRIPSSTSDAGFTLIRRNRVIIGGPDENYRPAEIFGGTNTFPYQRLYGELHMDNWPVTQTKDKFNWSNEDLENAFIEKLKEVSDEYKKKATEIRTKKTKNAQTKSDEATFETKSEEPPVAIVETIKNKAKTLKFEEPEEPSLKNSSEFFKSNKLNINQQSSEIKNNDFSEPAKENKIFVSWSKDDKDYNFSIDFNANFQQESWMNISRRNEKKIIINTSHPFFQKYKNDKNALIAISEFSFSLAMSEMRAYNEVTDENGNIPPSQIRQTMDDILKNWKTPLVTADKKHE